MPPRSPVDDQLSVWRKVRACQGNQQRSIALRPYYDMRHRWNGVAPGSQPPREGQPHRPILLVQQVADCLLFLGENPVEIQLGCLALSTCWQSSYGMALLVCWPKLRA